jgi:predicted DNA-binding transcriptional regulator AlpA
VSERLNEPQHAVAAPVRLVHGSKAATILSDYFTEDELAAALGCTTRTLRRWHALGDGPPRTKLGGCRVLYRRGAVERWLASRESAGRRGGQRRAA